MKHYHCPVNGWDCPYYLNEKIFPNSDKPEFCLCTIEEQGDGNPYEECDDFYAIYGDDCDPCDYTDYTDND